MNLTLTPKPGTNPGRKKKLMNDNNKKNNGKKRCGGRWWWNSYSSSIGWMVQCINPLCPMKGEDKAYRPIGIMYDVIIGLGAICVGGAIASAVSD